MAQLFEGVFSPQGIHEILFFNCKTVLEYPTLKALEEDNPDMYERWGELSKNKYNREYHDEVKENEDYLLKAARYPEFSRIVAISYGSVFIKDGEIQRKINRIVNDDEFIVISTFLEGLRSLDEGNKHPILCGHNVINHDIPLLIKKCVQYRDKLTNGVPSILKKSLDIKPWESGVIDIIDVWKLNGYDRTPLMVICDFLGLKKTTDLLPVDELSKEYWVQHEHNPEAALEFVSLQCATQTNLVIQLMNTLREL